MEASPEQMARCSAEAERYSKSTGVLTRIIGWYHSHPHITVHASHVDVRTQACSNNSDAPDAAGCNLLSIIEPTAHFRCVAGKLSDDGQRVCWPHLLSLQRGQLPAHPLHALRFGLLGCQRDITRSPGSAAGKLYIPLQ